MATSTNPTDVANDRAATATTETPLPTSITKDKYSNATGTRFKGREKDRVTAILNTAGNNMTPILEDSIRKFR
jgi:hypothetical protein